jgi:hypothetical protein
MSVKGHAPRDQWQRFMPGHTGNPLGRPKKWKRGEIVAAYRELGDTAEFADWLLRRSKAPGKAGTQATEFMLGLWAPHPKYGLKPPSRRLWR